MSRLLVHIATGPENPTPRRARPARRPVRPGGRPRCGPLPGGVRAAQAHDAYSAERARTSNDAQVLALGARVIGPELARSIVSAWLAAEFGGGGSTRKVEKIDRLEREARAGG